MKRMEINIEYILDYLDQYEKDELTEEQLVKALAHDEKVFLVTHQGLLEVGNGVEGSFDILN